MKAKRYYRHTCQSKSAALIVSYKPPLKIAALNFCAWNFHCPTTGKDKNLNRISQTLKFRWTTLYIEIDYETSLNHF